MDNRIWKKLSKYGIRELPLELLYVPTSYQREFRLAHARRLAACWDCNMAQVIRVVPDHELHMFRIIDGQHSVKAAALAGMMTIECKIIPEWAGDEQRQAQAFLALNSLRKPLTPLETHTASVFTGDAVSVAVERQAIRHGLTFVQGGKKRDLSGVSITGPKKVVERYGEDALDFAFTVITEAWPQDERARDHAFVLALGRLYTTHPELAGDGLAGTISALARREPSELLAAARAGRKERSTGLADELYRAVYRSRRRRELRIAKAA